MVRRGVAQPGRRSLSQDVINTRTPANGADSLPEPSQSADVPTDNPWRETRPGSSHRSNTAPAAINHRLSYDFGSGVIVLPEDADWLENGEDSESDDDYGSPVDEPHSTEEPTASSTAETQPAGGVDVRASSISKSRHRTYFHHPERRRLAIPGAFPSSQT